MEIAIIAIVAAGASLLTFFSGFGLGTILLPVMVLFFPVDLAIALTAIVHLLNGIFKTGLMSRHADKTVVLNFGIPALLFAFAGASLLVYLSEFPIVVQYKLVGYPLSTSPVKVIIGLLLCVFAVIELLPTAKRKENNAGSAQSKSRLFLGGVLSGFFGGLSGHQGALRSAFLIKAGLTKEGFIATGIIISLLIDVTRIPVYLSKFDRGEILQNWSLLLAATLSAFAGAYAGRKLMKKVTLHFVQVVVTVMVIAIGILLGLGVI